MKKIRMIIIDSGVRKDHPKFAGDVIEGFSLSLGRYERNFTDLKGHGTAVYGILRETRDFCEIINVKIMEQQEYASEDILIDTLEYVLERLPADLVNLSAGLNICEQYNRLKSICERLDERGTVIVASFDNSNSISYPAAFKNVIGVNTGSHCSVKSDIEYVENSLINICGKGGVQRLCWTAPDYVMLGGNSFACAHVSVEIAKLMRQGIRGRGAILSALREKAKFIYTLPISSTTPMQNPKIHKAAIFPFNKEMHSLIRFSDLLDFEIMDVYDVKYSPNIGADTNHLLKEKLPVNIRIKNVNSIDWERIDALILGHLDELSAAVNQLDLIQNLLHMASAHGIYVYAFDDLSHLLDTMDNPPDSFFPRIREENLPANNFGKLYRISKPVVGIFGTSSRQGKFTLQLCLRRKFLEAGYRIGQIGTEPSSLLYGMDSVFPMGYNASVYIKEFDVIRYLNCEVNRLCLNGCEIILAGSQSGTVQYDNGNTAQFNLPQYEFLMGIQPDCVVLCVNPFDDVSFIERTVQFIEAAVDCKVISLVMFPMDFKYNFAGIYGGKEALSNEKFQECKALLEERLAISVYRLGVDEDITAVANGIADFFAAEE